MNKNELRRQKKEITKKAEADSAIFNSVTSLKEFKNAHTIFIYLSTADEPETDAIITEALRAGKKVCVPRCRKAPQMDAVVIRSLSAFKTGAYGIREPLGSETVEKENIDLAIIPCVKAGTDGRRLGHGKGYYDCFMSGGRFLKVCLCYSENITDEIETEEHDILMDIVITQNDVFVIR